MAVEWWFPFSGEEGRRVREQRWLVVLGKSPAPTAADHACSQISTQRKMNVYNILQEIIQQEGEMEERCIQKLVAIASKQMRDITEVVGPGLYHTFLLQAQALDCS